MRTPLERAVDKVILNYRRIGQPRSPTPIHHQFKNLWNALDELVRAWEDNEK